jgi:hypothetical protein
MASEGRQRIVPKVDITGKRYDDALDNAIKSIYKTYGSNLSAFFKDLMEKPSPVPASNRSNNARSNDETGQTTRREKSKTIR